MEFFRRKYGDNELKELHILWNTAKKYTNVELEEMVILYKKLLESWRPEGWGEC